MNLFLLIPAIVLLVLGITRGVCRDWKWSILCLALGATLFVVHHRRLVASAKERAREYRIEQDTVDSKHNE
jgi:membrane protein implicated in regulation of membrane protease activity